MRINCRILYLQSAELLEGGEAAAVPRSSLSSSQSTTWQVKATLVLQREELQQLIKGFTRHIIIMRRDMELATITHKDRTICGRNNKQRRRLIECLHTVKQQHFRTGEREWRDIF